MNFIALRAEPLTREIPLSRLALDPENVRKTPSDPRADAELKASIAALGLLKNLVVRVDHPVPCLVRADGNDAGEVSLAENVVRIAMHPADQVVAFTKLAEAG